MLTQIGALGLGMIGLAATFHRMRALRGTTLVAACWWSVVALGCVTAIEALGMLPGTESAGTWYTSLRFAAAMTTFCPLMAVLGAQRPHDGAWQFIVLSLWIVLSLPSTGWLVSPVAIHDIHPAHSWFLLILLALGLLDGLPTRKAAAASCWTAGQIALLLPFLPLVPPQWAGADGQWLGVGLIGLGALLTPSGRRRSDRAAAPLAEPVVEPLLEKLDWAWLDFRDTYGAIWAMRIADRFNTSAATCGWNARLRWSGFRAADDGRFAPSPAEREGIDAALRGLLRRFVAMEARPPRTVDWGG